MDSLSIVFLSVIGLYVLYQVWKMNDERKEWRSRFYALEAVVEELTTDRRRRRWEVVSKMQKKYGIELTDDEVKDIVLTDPKKENGTVDWRGALGVCG